ncbi:MAG TPA: hypothetical protein VHE60_15570 [Pyrinomonadaceae bacterium]|nr:hypothetical protein [Pyrinomonadaceae bacterium]
MSEERSCVVLLGILILATGFILACDKPSDQAKTPELEPRVVSSGTPSPQTSQVPLPAATPTQATPSPAPPPKLTEVNEAMTRVFQKAAALDPASVPGFVVGDFNGDGSEDLAIVTKTSEGSLGEINNEMANWILEDPRNVPIPGTTQSRLMAPGKRVRAEKGDTLLAIIHGAGPKGWRNPEAKQTFLLKNGAGSNMTVLAVKVLLASKGKAKLPPMRGDTISQTIGGKPGILFWTGAKYAWYPSPE